MSKIEDKTVCILCGELIPVYKMNQHAGTKKCLKRMALKEKMESPNLAGPVLTTEDRMKQVPNWKGMADRVSKVGDIFL